MGAPPARMERGEGAAEPARLLAGAGRARDTAAALAALSAVDEDGERRRPQDAAASLADLEELLLAGRPPEGLLILDSARVPDEDIGFVRRFLERHPGWRLLVLGAEEREPRTLALAALPRATFVAWPPDLAELRQLLGAPPPGAPSSVTGAPERRAPRRAGASPAAPATAAPPANGSVEVGGLVEELLASAALEGGDAPRYQFRANGPFRVTRDRARLAEGLAGLLDLARRCAGSDGLVRATVHPGGDRVRIGLDFPRGALGEKDLPAALAEVNGASRGDHLAPARRAAALLRELGAELELGAGEPGRLRYEVRLAVEPPARSRGKLEDPFA